MLTWFCLYAGALDACISSQTVLAVDTAPNGAVRSLSEGVNLPKDVVKGLMASAWAPDMDVQHAQAAKLAALRVHTSMLLPGAAEPSKASPFAKGTRRLYDLASQTTGSPDSCLRAFVVILLIETGRPQCNSPMLSEACDTQSSCTSQGHHWQGPWRVKTRC